MSKIKALIIDDEQDARENLKVLLSKHCKDVEILGEADSVETGLALLNEKGDAIDLAFLDIDLKDGLSFDILKNVQEWKFEIIFVTAYSEYAQQAFEFSAIGYVTKPISGDELQKAVSRFSVAGKHSFNQRVDVLSNYLNNPNAFEKITIPAIDGYHFVKMREIVRLEGEDNYTHIFLNDSRKLTVSKTIKEYEKNLSPFNFFRVHKSHLINLNYMKKFVRGEGGYIIMEDGKNIEVSRRRRASFMERLRKI